jgi:hypothetical protein
MVENDERRGAGRSQPPTVGHGFIVLRLFGDSPTNLCRGNGPDGGG